MHMLFPSALGSLVRRLSAAAAGVALLLTLSTPAAAQVSAAGGITQLLASTTRGVDAAYDPVNNVYLVIGAYGPVTGVFVGLDGQAVGAPFAISGGAGHSNFARARYSPQLGGFMVTWSSEDSPTSLTVRTRGVTYPGALVGSENVVSDAGTRPWLEASPAIAYSSTSQQFLIVWQGYPPSITIKARLVGLNGAGVGSIVELSSGYGRDPGVTWNPNRNEFGVSFSGETPTGSYSAMVLVPASNPAALSRNTFNILGGGILTYITDIAFSTSSNRYVMTWYEAVKARVAEFDENGTLLRGDIASVRVGMYDSLSLAYNPVSQTFLVVGLDPVTDNLTSVELNQNGVRFGNEVLLGAASAYYARVGAATNAARWLGVYAKTFRATGVPAVTASINGGPSGGGSTPPPNPPPSNPPPPPPPPSSSCPGGEIPGMTCVNGEYVPTGSTGGGGSTGSSCPGGTIPGMTCVNGEWVPSGSTGGGGSTGGDGSCPGGVIPGMTCVNGEYVPTGSTGGGGSTGGSNCPGGTIPGMTCVNGEWVPSGSTGGGSGGGSSCPGGTIPGMTCVNGDWVPNGSTGGGGGGSSCPGGTIPGMTCVNGDWVPTGSTGGSSTGGDGSCPGGVIPGMTCVNGDYIPTGSTGGGGSSCPGGTIPGMTCVNGEWVPSGSGGGGGSSCPGFVPGMTCVNGEWTFFASATPASDWDVLDRLHLVEPRLADRPYVTRRSLRA